MRMMGLVQRRAVQSFSQKRRSVVYGSSGGCHRGMPEVPVTRARHAVRNELSFCEGFERSPVGLGT